MEISKLITTAGQELGLLLICALMTTGLSSAYAQDAELHTEEYVISPKFMLAPAAHACNRDHRHDAVDPFADPIADSAAPFKRRTVKDIFMEAGVVFAPGTSAIYNPKTSQLIVKNTKEQLELVEAYIESITAKAERQIRIKIEWFELSHNDFNELMKEDEQQYEGEKIPSNNGSLRDRVMEMVQGEKGAVIDTAMIVARSGQRAKVESVMEVIYPTKYVRSKPEIVEVDAKGKKTGDTKGSNQVFLLPVADAYETRNVGTTLEVDPVLGADDYTIDLAISPEIVYLAGDQEYGVYSEGESKVTARSPVFYSVKATTQVTLIKGDYLLFAVNSPINEEKGMVDRTKKVMAFVKADVLYSGLPIKKQ